MALSYEFLVLLYMSHTSVTSPKWQVVIVITRMVKTMTSKRFHKQSDSTLVYESAMSGGTDNLSSHDSSKNHQVPVNIFNKFE